MTVPQTIEIDSSDRVFITGKTGSGKSFLARELVRPLERLVVLDPKFSLGSWQLSDWDKDSRELLRNGDPVQIRVTWQERGESIEFWDDVLWECFESGNLTVYIDELYSLAPQGNWMPEVMQRIWTQGRELGIGAFSASQRPRWIPPFTVSECEHFFVFRLLKLSDRKFMSDFMGDDVLIPIPHDAPYGFYYYNVYWQEPIYVPGLQVGHGDLWGDFEEVSTVSAESES